MAAKIALNPFVQMMYDTDMAFVIADVADAADANYKAATTNGLHGKNYLLSSETYKVSDTSPILNQLAPKNPGSIVYKMNWQKLIWESTSGVAISSQYCQITLFLVRVVRTRISTMINSNKTEYHLNKAYLQHYSSMWKYEVL